VPAPELSDDVPWLDVRLEGTREVIADAVDSRTLHRPGLRSAIATLLATCGETAVKVLGEVWLQALLARFGLAA